MITQEQLGWLIAPRPRGTLVDALYPYLEPAMLEFEIDTPLRQAHFIAQTAWETDRYCALVEYASGDDYDTRTDLGNTAAYDGDGRKYKGRGIMMLTGAGNVGRCSDALFGDRRVLLDDPQLLSDDLELAVRSGAWFWWSNGLNRWADEDNIVKLTRKINGGRNGLEGRKTFYERAAYAYGLIS